jgi:hypothetical protein
VAEPPHLNAAELPREIQVKLPTTSAPAVPASA